MPYRCFDLTITDAVAHVVLSRPDELNTMTADFYRELPEIVTGISRDASARAVVLSSTGRHFSAGMDLSVFAGADRGRGGAETGRANAALLATVRHLQHAFSALEEARVPVIAATQGGVIGGAVDLVTACDIRYASADAFFCVMETNIGMTADLGTLQRLGKVVPEGFAREMAYTGRRVPAQRALEAGLVQQVFPDHASLVEGALQTAREIAAQSPLAVWGTKVAMNFARDHTVAEGLQQIGFWQTGMFQPADMAEAFTAKAEGRAPVYADLLPETDDLL